MKSPKIHGQPEDDQEQYDIQKIIITLVEETVMLVRIVQENPPIPPYYLENLTRYEITIRQKTDNILKIKNNQFNYSLNQPIILQPKEKVAFTWNNWIDDEEHQLEVEIEGQQKDYKIEQIKDFDPIEIQNNQTISKINKKFLFYQGFINMKTLDKVNEYFCIVDVVKQKILLYTKDKKSKTVFSLKKAKLEESKENDFRVIIDAGRSSENYLTFQCQDQQITQKWIEFIQRAIQIGKPETIELKIEPKNSSRVLTFQSIMPDNLENEQIINKKKGPNGLSTFTTVIKMNDEENDYELVREVQNEMLIEIRNCIGISVIDNEPKELIQISVKNLKLAYKTIVKYAKPSEQQLSDEENQYQLQKVTLSVQVDLLIINNQLLDAQFPVLLAPNKKAIIGNQQPFLMISLIWKENNLSNQLKEQNSAQKISYIQEFFIFMDTIEIRLDEYILNAFFNFSFQVKQSIANGKPILKETDDKQLNLCLIDTLKPINIIIDDQRQQIDNSVSNMKYVKNLILEPIQICFTFRSSPGNNQHQTAKAIIGDFGLTLASIDSYKINLNSLKIQHLLGSSNELVQRILKNYQRQLIQQLLKIFGSFEFLGDPVSLIQDLGTGVSDMFYEPLYALITGKSGEQVGQKIVSGALSLLSHSVSGLYKTVTKILNSILKILANITLDKQYIHERQNRMNRAIKNIKEAIYIGFQNFFNVLLEALFGFFKLPFREAQHGGLLGFLKGSYSGIVSLVLKPTIGIFDLLLNILEGIKNQAIYEDHIMDQRYRPPRIFGGNNILIPFDYVPAMGKDIIRRIKIKEIEIETVLFFDEIEIIQNKKKLIVQVVLSDLRLVYVYKHTQIGVKVIMIHKIEKIQLNEKNEMILTMRIPSKKNFFTKYEYREILKYESKKKFDDLINQMKNQSEIFNIQFD